MKRKDICKAMKYLLSAMLWTGVFGSMAFAGTWVQNGNAWEYHENGAKLTNRWIENNGQWFYLKPDGNMANGEWIRISDIDYYMNEGGALAQNQWLKYQGKWYYLGKSGAMVHNQAVDGYFISSDGVWRKNETAKAAKASGRIVERRRTYTEDFSTDFDDEEVFSEDNGDWV